ncbi:hypothetical protein MWU54_05785 [Marivita sp. S6314]|uniref:hypothetical protein n=1 Tax=Marivita sp. S6314 TaxID=2926406 RepID=UPI001FF259FF|nr:hypothetical protein [Marivita sp. S6314]MCK0149524.1 hypothetical protein [Marivita sp. S6314]
MKIGIAIAAVIAAIAVAFGVYMIDIDQTQQAELPEVNIEGGQLPEFDAEMGDVTVTEEEVTVTVPSVEITPPTEDEDIASN